MYVGAVLTTLRFFVQPRLEILDNGVSFESGRKQSSESLHVGGVLTTLSFFWIVLVGGWKLGLIRKCQKTEQEEQ